MKQINTYIVEDDTADSVRLAVCASSLAFKGDVWWVANLYDLKTINYRQRSTK